MPFGSGVPGIPAPRGDAQIITNFGGVQEKIEDISQLNRLITQYANQSGATTPIYGGGGQYTVPRVNLDKYKANEIAAATRLAHLKYQGVRTELEGSIAQTELDRDRNIAGLERDLRIQTRQTRGNALARGILDSGIYLEDQAEVEGQIAEQRGYEEASAANLIGGLQSQISLLGAQRAAEIASQRAQIERAYLMARLSGL